MNYSNKFLSQHLTYRLNARIFRLLVKINLKFLTENLQWHSILIFLQVFNIIK